MPVRIEISGSCIINLFYLWLEFTLHVNKCFELYAVSAVSFVCPVEMMQALHWKRKLLDR